MNTIAWITSKGEQHDIKDTVARQEKLNISDLPQNVSYFINDAGYITNAVNNLINYYSKSETYSKEQIDAIVTPKLNIQIVDTLPTSEISTTTIYFLRRNRPSGTTQYESDIYDEYIYVGGTWELIGNTYVDLSDYYTKAETDDKISIAILSETQARTLADTTLQNNIDGVQSNLNATNLNLNAEISARQQKNLQHETNINTNATNISNEITRATNAENTLSDRIDVFENHLTDGNNPHNVTKSQVGLGNVANVGTTNTITNNSEENVTSGAVYTALESKVDKVQGKGLSDQNFTYAEKTKLANLSNYDDTTLAGRVTATENAITTLNGNSSVSGSVDKKIADALAGVTQIDFVVVETLPSTGVKGVIYFVLGVSEQGQNRYTEYVWLGNAFEKVGESVSVIDMANYYTKAESNALLSGKNGKITVTASDTALTDSDTVVSASGTNPTSFISHTLLKIATYISNKISDLFLSKANPNGTGSFSLNRKSNTEIGSYSVSTGFDNTASGDYSHAEGGYNTASGDYSHAEGGHNTASGSRSHAEGYINTASGDYSHVEGSSNIASGDYSHVQGQWNVEDSNGEFADIIGNGTRENNRKNIEATTWSGDKRLKGTLYIECNDDSTGGTNIKTEISNTNKKTKYFGTCATSRATNAKVVTCNDFVLETGCKITVKFTDTAGSAPTSGNITLNVNSTGAKNVYNKNYSQMTYAHSGEFRANRHCEFVYDGTNFIWLNYDSNTTYSTITQAEITAGTSTSSRLVTPKLLNDNFVKKSELLDYIKNNLALSDFTYGQLSGD